MQYEQAIFEGSSNGCQRQFAASRVNISGLYAPQAKGGRRQGRAQVGNRGGLKLTLRRLILRHGPSLLAFVRNPIAIQRWVVVLFILAALSTLIVDGISMSMSVSTLLERDVLAP